MVSSISDIDKMLKKAMKFKDRNAKIAYIGLMAQSLMLEAQKEELERSLESSDDKAKGKTKHLSPHGGLCALGGCSSTGDGN